MSEIQRCRRFPNLFCKRLVVLSDKENVRILNVPESQRNLEVRNCMSLFFGTFVNFFLEGCSSLMFLSMRDRFDLSKHE